MKYYQCTNDKRTVYLQPDQNSLAAYLSFPENVHNARIISDDGSFSLTMRGDMIETCSDLKAVEQLRRMIIVNQFSRSNEDVNGRIKYFSNKSPNRGPKR